MYGAVTLLGRTFQTVPLTLSSESFPSGRQSVSQLPTTRLWSCNPSLSFRIAWFTLFRLRSPLLAESRLFSLPPGTEMVHFPGFASCHYVFIARSLVFAPGGFPHSDISGSQTVCV